MAQTMPEMMARKAVNRRIKFLRVMGDSIVEKSITESFAARHRGSMRPFRAKRWNSSFELLVVGVLFLPAPDPAQNHSSAYQKTVLSIQSLIDANKLDDARAA